MKTRKLKSDYDPDTTALYRMIKTLATAKDESMSRKDSADFRSRCGDAIIALAGRLLERVEACYAPERKRFRVTYDVKRSGSHDMEVEAETREEAEYIAQDRLVRMRPNEFDGMHTDFIAADVYEAKEVEG